MKDIFHKLLDFLRPFDSHFCEREIIEKCQDYSDTKNVLKFLNPESLIDSHEEDNET